MATVSIHPVASAAKNPKTGQPFVASAFAITSSGFSVAGLLVGAKVVFLDASGNALPDGAVPRSTPIDAAAEAELIAAAVNATPGKDGEFLQDYIHRAAKVAVVTTRGITLA